MRSNFPDCDGCGRAAIYSLRAVVTLVVVPREPCLPRVQDDSGERPAGVLEQVQLPHQQQLYQDPEAMLHQQARAGRPRSGTRSATFPAGFRHLHPTGGHSFQSRRGSPDCLTRTAPTLLISASSSRCEKANIFHQPHRPQHRRCSPPSLPSGHEGWLDALGRRPHCSEVILVEGLFDYAALRQAGFDNVTCSLGTYLNADSSSASRRTAHRLSHLRCRCQLERPASCSTIC